MRFSFFKPKSEWPPPPPEFGQAVPDRRRFLRNRAAGLATVFLFGFLIYAVEGAAWMKRLTMGVLFCGLIYMRDDSPSGRWLTIAIIAIGTLLSIFLPLFGIGDDLLRSSF
ncbi:MAG: hypothetical protein ONB46_05615 [candidate division KSB1 bacterium]|nr:hypothetical protein [candidate division KSB1 bacterium]MDZ7365417.1 hypothetical protein [candidate division KSB1 bacterium]MDZ7403536.1 hypothetical protein [candidate division KSB1 bacterium]